ncbi:MAG: NAD(P)/FAD-dependent oxidoreductase [Nitrososphaerales archaeon]
MTCDVLVVGGGSTGSSIAYHLATRGITNSILVEKGEQIASGQTSKSTALVRTHYSNPVVAHMAAKSLEFFENFERMLGRDCGFQLTGLILGADAIAEKALSENVVMLRELGIESKTIDKDHALALEPHLNVGAFSLLVFEPKAGYAEPSLTASAFSSKAEDLGARVLTRTKVLAIEKIQRRGENVYAVDTSMGQIEAKKIVIANGVWSKKLFEKLGINSIPIKPVRHPVVVYKRPNEYSGRRPLIFDFPHKAYYKPEGNRLFYAGSLELELDTDAREVDPDNYSQDVTFEEIEKLTAGVSECIPVMGESGTFTGSYTGVYDITPDEQPVIDELSGEGYEGIYCLVGLSGHGFKLCPEFGRIIAGMIIDGKFNDYDVSIFERKRFSQNKLIKSKYALGTIG